MMKYLGCAPIKHIGKDSIKNMDSDWEAGTLVPAFFIYDTNNSTQIRPQGFILRFRDVPGAAGKLESLTVSRHCHCHGSRLLSGCLYLSGAPLADSCNKVGWVPQIPAPEGSLQFRMRHEQPPGRRQKGAAVVCS